MTQPLKVTLFIFLGSCVTEVHNVGKLLVCPRHFMLCRQSAKQSPTALKFVPDKVGLTWSLKGSPRIQQHYFGRCWARSPPFHDPARTQSQAPVWAFQAHNAPSMRDSRHLHCAYPPLQCSMLGRTCEWAWAEKYAITWKPSTDFTSRRPAESLSWDSSRAWEGMSVDELYEGGWALVDATKNWSKLAGLAQWWVHVMAHPKSNVQS